MPRKVSFYVFIASIIVAAFGFGLFAGNIFLRAPSRPDKEAKPAVTDTGVTEIREQVLPVEATPAPAATEARIRVPTKPEFQKGMILVAWTPNGYNNESIIKSLEQLRGLGVEWVGLVTTWYQERYNTTDIYPDKEKTPTEESLLYAIRKLHEMKFKVMLKPHLDLADGQGKWRGDITFDSEADWQTWFENYSAFVLKYAGLAAQENVALLCIGTELGQSTIHQPGLWKDLIKKIKEVYPGQLTYAANWDQYDKIDFWGELDYAGIDPYFPLVCTINPKTEELKSAWEDWIKPIEEWQKKIDKPVIFAEAGYKSSKDATDEPWQHTAVGEVDLELQVNCYRAALESFWEKPWFYGIYWWYWGVNPRMGGVLNRGFTPQNKPSQETIREWYQKPVPAKAY